jgi:hypothetical protein
MPNYLEIEANIALALASRDFDTERVNLTALAKEYDVPYLRLKARANGRRSRSTREPTNRALNNEQEAALIIWLQRCDEIGVSAR